MTNIKEFSIPPLPQVVLQVMQYDHNSPTANTQDIEKIVAPDKGITAEILKVANSAYYGRSGRVKVLRDATALLGLKALKNLIIFLGTKGLNEKIKHPILKKYTNALPIVSALLAKEIAIDLKKESIKEEVFLAALLHKIGMSILAVNKSDHYALIIQECEENEFDLTEIEQKSYGINHSELGKKVSADWKLPEELIRCCGIGTHTKVEELQSDLEKITFISSICAMELLHIPIEPTNYQKANQIYKSLGGEGDVIIKFANDQMLERIKQHPFYQLSLI
ncbi:MAG: HDOD domain-containing protein [Leptospiraceae bacterium]|nr:HDOD domain-containing protein [Leptospiraceae bacterium]MDW7975611.1 HDOD domain-containing protein [Leptospiraceae bacterium]